MMETLNFKLFNVFVLFGVFQGLLLMGIFLFNKRYRKKSNFALVLILLFVVLMGLGNTLEDLRIHETYPVVVYIPFYTSLLFPFGLYYFVVFSMNPAYQFSKKDYWWVIPLVIQLSFNIGMFFAYLAYPSYLESQKENRFLYYRFSEFVMFIVWLYVILSTLKKIRIYHRQLFNNYSNIEGKDFFWLKGIMLVFLPLWASNFFSQAYNFYYRESPFIFFINQICISILIYWVSYFILLRRDIFEIPVFSKSDDPKNNKAVLSDKTDEHYQKLLQLMQKEKLYQDAELNMDILAEKTQLSNGYLSKIINQKEGKNFYDFINTYRVNEVKANLNHPDFSHYSILGIGLEAGFKSKSTFNSVFKKMTGMTPSAFKRSLGES